VPETSSAPAASASRRCRLKICGLTDPDQAAAIAALGVEAIGVVAVPGSPRFLPMERRAPLYAAAHRQDADCLGVLVVADPSDTELATLRVGNGHQVVQLHGSESVERCRQLREALGPGMGLWKALRIRSPEDLDQCGAYAAAVDALLLDAWVPDQLGGTGHQIPLPWLEGLSPHAPWWLAGGIRPERVGAVLRAVTPFGLDASSGVESRPGYKDLDRVGWLLRELEAARGAVAP